MAGENSSHWKGGKSKCGICGKQLSGYGKKNCIDCHVKFFSKGKNNGHWKGGIDRSDNGYIKILSPNHPSTTKKKYIFEHRLVAEKCLGRYLTKIERVHHINGIKDDNRTENLYLFSCEREHQLFHHDPHKIKSNLY